MTSAPSGKTYEQVKSEIRVSKLDNSAAGGRLLPRVVRETNPKARNPNYEMAPASASPAFLSLGLRALSFFRIPSFVLRISTTALPGSPALQGFFSRR